MFSGILAMPAFGKREFLLSKRSKGRNMAVLITGVRYGRIHRKPYPQRLAHGHSGTGSLGRRRPLRRHCRDIFAEIRYSDCHQVSKHIHARGET